MQVLKFVQYIFWISLHGANLLYSGACTSHAGTVGFSVWKLADDILSINEANKVIYQSDIPFTVPSSGAYAVGETLINTSTAPVITNTHTNVVIDFKGHSIINQLAVSDATAISLQENSQTTICNGFIDGSTYGIVMSGVSNALIQGMGFIGTTTNIRVTNSSNIEICETDMNGFVDFTNVTNSIVKDSILINSFSLLFMRDCSGVTVMNMMGSGAVLSGVINSKFENTYLDSGASVISYRINNSSHNIFTRLIRENSNLLADLVGTSSCNTFDKVIGNRMALVLRINTGVNKTRLLSSVLQGDVMAGGAAVINNGTNTEMYNNLIRQYVPVSGSVLEAGLVITNTNVVANDANYWQNLLFQNA